MKWNEWMKNTGNRKNHQKGLEFYFGQAQGTLNVLILRGCPLKLVRFLKDWLVWHWVEKQLLEVEYWKWGEIKIPILKNGKQTLLSLCCLVLLFLLF